MGIKYQSSNTKTIYSIDFDTDRKKRYVCPECGSYRKKKNQKDLEFYPDTKRAYCHHCNTTYFEYTPYDTGKQYTAPEWTNLTSLTDKSVKWFTGRKISQNTLLKMNICSVDEYMPQFGKVVECIAFPMYVKEKCTNVKYRAGGKNFKLYSGAELVWYNYNALLNFDEIFICEGEIDLLSFVECGYDNVISVPNGANKRLDFLDSSYHLFENKKRVIIASDNDEKGIILRDELIRRIGREKCCIMNLKQHKDPNELLCKDGNLEFKKLANNPIELPIDGAVELHSIYDRCLNLYENGMQKGMVTGIKEIDKYVSWETGRMCVSTGAPQSGKSEVNDLIVSRLCLRYDLRCAYYTPENSPLEYHYEKWHTKITGQPFKKGENSVDFDNTFEWINDHVKYIYDEDDMTLDKVLEVAKSYVIKYGIKILVIDPYNRLDHNMDSSSSETQYVSKFLADVISFGKKYDVLTFLVAHPTKLNSGQVPTLYNISGSAHFYNKTDYGFTVHRVRDDDGLALSETEIYWQKIKFKHLGEQGKSKMDFDPINGRHYPFGCEKNNDNWLENDLQNDEEYSKNIESFTNQAKEIERQNNAIREKFKLEKEDDWVNLSVGFDDEAPF